MKNVIYKKIILLLLFAVFAITCFAQTIKGKVISSSDKQPIPYVTVKLKWSNTVTLSNNEGEFSLEKNNQLPTDTLIVSSIGFLSQTIALNHFLKNEIITLKEDEQSLNEVKVSAGKKQYKMLSDFSYFSAAYSIEKDTAQSFVSSKFPIAKAFTANVDSFKLESIHLGRYVEVIIKSAKALVPTEAQKDLGRTNDVPTRYLFYDLKKHVQRAIFNLYIIYPEKSGQPAPLANATKIPIDINNGQTLVEIDLRSYNIRPKQRDFYVVIEWLSILPNQNYSLGIPGTKRIFRQTAWPIYNRNRKDGNPPIALVYEVGYEPFVSMYKIKTEDTAKKYALIQNEWMPLTAPDNAKTDDELTLSAKISYYQ